MINKLKIQVFLKLRWFFFNKFSWIIKRNLFTKPKSNSSEYTLGVVTYIARWSIFRKICLQLCWLFSDKKIIVIANGYYDEEKQKKYLIKLSQFLEKKTNVLLICFNEPQSLSKCWNTILLNSKTEKTFILNDDLILSAGFRKEIDNIGILNNDLSIINSSWSHFLISTKIVNNVGWFDERIYGVGGEDWDYEARCVFKNILVNDQPIKTIYNNSIFTRDFSYGKNVETVSGKYTKSSSDFLFTKWEICNKNDVEGKYIRIWKNYVKPIKGLETPNFYSNK